MRILRRNRKRREGGQAMVEFSLCLTVLATVLIAVYQFGGAISDYIDLAESSRACAHTAARSGANVSGDITGGDYTLAKTRGNNAAAAVASKIPGYTSIVYAETTWAVGNGVKCDVTANYNVAVFGVNVVNGTMHSSNTMRIAQQIA